mgnify:CR=1 FL=1
MFGYVIADLARLDEGQQTRYKSFYLSLIHISEPTRPY